MSFLFICVYYMLPDVMTCFPVSPAAFCQQIEDRSQLLLDLITLRRKQTKKSPSGHFSRNKRFLFLGGNSWFRFLSVYYFFPHRVQASFHEQHEGVDTIHVNPLALLRAGFHRHHQQHVKTLERKRWQQVDCVTVGWREDTRSNIAVFKVFKEYRVNTHV